MDLELIVIMFGLFGVLFQQILFRNLNAKVEKAVEGVADVQRELETTRNALQEMAETDGERDERIERLHEKLDDMYDGDGETASQLTAPSVPDELDRVYLKPHGDEMPSTIVSHASNDVTGERTSSDSDSVITPPK